MTREEFYNLTDILNSEVLGNFMHGGEADELLAMFEEAVDHSNILEQEEPVSEDLEEAARKWLNPKLYKAYANYGETKMMELTHFDGYNMLDAIEFGAKWQKKHLWKDAQGNDLPTIDREVIALLNNGKVVFAHRPYKGKYLGKNLTTGNIETYENKTYDEGGWNQPNVKWWLDIEKLPNMEE